MTNEIAQDDQRKLTSLIAATLEQDGGTVQMFETHISRVLVSKDFAYKFKKPVRFDFVDFSTLDARHFYCRQELRLNRRLAPDLYLGVVPITGSRERPLIDGPGAPIEYAVKMRSFSQQSLWNHRIEAGALSEQEIDALAEKIARFHAAVAPAEVDSAWGAPDALQAAANGNLETIAALANGAEEMHQIRELRTWHATQHQMLFSAFNSRKAHGWIRECHGDLHAGNILTIDGRVEVFDCIEFNDSLRWIDVINDIAFTCMDLQFQERYDLAARFLNQYLEITGDYEGLIVLRYYQIQRALVRCKVALLRVRQLRADGQDAVLHERQAGQYLSLAAKSIRPAPAAIMITHGYSGSGKSTFAGHLVGLFGAIRIRSDVERKRMHGLAAASRATASPDAGLYAASATQITYGSLCMLARHIVESGLPVVVDAAFLRQEQRELFEDLAHALHVPFFIFDIRAGEAAMKERITARLHLDQDASDAGLAVLAHQIAHHDPLSDAERRHVIEIDSERGMDRETIRHFAEPVVRALQQSANEA